MTTAHVLADVHREALLIKAACAGRVMNRVRHAVELVKTLASLVHRHIFTSSIWLFVCKLVRMATLKVSIDSVMSQITCLIHALPN